MSQPVSGTIPQNTNSMFRSSGVLLCIFYYTFCSSTLLMFNKVAIFCVPAPLCLLLVQLVFTVVGIKMLAVADFIDAVDLEWEKIKSFLPVALLFLLTIFTNIKVLQHCNVETFITFKCSTPLVMSLLDYVFLGRTLPSIQSWASLVVLLLGAAGYTMLDSNFNVTGYLFIVAWYSVFCVDMVFIKRVTDTVEMTNWARAYYQNVLALVPLGLGLMFIKVEVSVFINSVCGVSSVFPILSSCVLGLAMSHASYMAMESMSATSFTIIGILCKVATVMINLFLWDLHASLAGLAFLLLW